MLHNDNDQYNAPLQREPWGPSAAQSGGSGGGSAAAVSVPHPQEPPSEKRRSSGGGRGCLIALVVILLIALLGSGTINCVLALDNFGNGLNSKIDSTKPTYRYKLVEGSEKDDPAKIVILPITGEINSESGDGVGSFASPENLRQALNYLADDDRVAAVILEVNSPGGGLTASDIMLHDLKRYKQKAKVPILAYFVDEACSGGYYVSMVSDEIYACPTTMTGSIGVIMQLPEISALMKKCGVNIVTIASLNSEGKPSFKDIGSPYRTMRPEERAMLQSLITESWEGFVQVVADGRAGRLTKAQVAKIADGRIFSAKQALAAKVIDGICYPDELYAKLRKKINKTETDSAVVRLERDSSLLDSFSELKLSSLLRPLGQVPELPASEVPQRYYRTPSGTVMR